MVPDYKKTWPDVEVNYLIISTEDYIVCLDKDLDVDWKTSDEYDRNGHDSEVEFNKILNEVALLESRPQHHLDENNRKNFRRMLGESVARALAHDYKSAGLIVRQAESFLLDRSREKSREWYLAAGGVSALIIFLVVGTLFVFRESFSLLLGLSDVSLLVSMLGGCIGSFISITLRLGKSNIEADSGLYLHIIEAISRVVTGSIGGVLSGILIKLGIIMPIFNGDGAILLGLFAIGFVAGASERFIPSFISKVEEKAEVHE